MKKTLAILLALMMLVMSIPAMATEATTGSITINQATKDQEYAVYRILDLVNYDVTENAYIYQTNDSWTGFVESTEIKGVYLEIHGEYSYVTWVKGADVAKFAELAIAYATANNIAAVATKTAENETVVFEGLELGYYLIQSSMGALCALDTTNPNMTVTEKNVAPTVHKSVQEDSRVESNDPLQYRERNDADIGQTVKFRSRITVGNGAINYVYHDTMDVGLTFDGAASISVYLLSAGTPLDRTSEHAAQLVDASNYTIVESGMADDCTFEIKFDNAYLKTLTQGQILEVNYTATLNEDAEVDRPNVNICWVTYGDEEQWETEKDSTTTYTWYFDVFKYYEKDGASQRLAGATFMLSKENAENAELATPIEFVKVSSNAAGNDIYRVATDDDAEESKVTTFTTNATTGRFELNGLDADTYYLYETEAPGGYNQLTEPIEIEIRHMITGVQGASAVYVNGELAEARIVGVKNETGSKLPETGGIGTTIFYVVGGVLMMGALVLLVTRKKMVNEE